MKKLNITLTASIGAAALVSLSGLAWAQSQAQTSPPSSTTGTPSSQRTMPSGTADTGQLNPSTSSGAVIDQTNRSTSGTSSQTVQGNDASRMNDNTVTPSSGSNRDSMGYTGGSTSDSDMSYSSNRAPRADRN